MAVNIDLGSGAFNISKQMQSLPTSSAPSDPISSEISSLENQYKLGYGGFGYEIVRGLERLFTPKEYSEAVNRYNALKASRVSEYQADKDRKWQEKMFKQSLDYNTYMSNTAYQRAVSDMKKAGLNPILAYQQGGSSTPTASAPSGARGSSYSAGNVSYKGLLQSVLELVSGLCHSVGTAIAISSK